jgi:hypothetical protein
MQRHFSTRGEALAEVTAARMLARRKRSAQSAFAVSQAGRRGTPEQWFSQPEEITPRPKGKQPKPNRDLTM